MKKTVICLLTAMCMFVLTACDNVNHKKFEKSMFDSSQQTSDVKLVVKENTVDPDTESITLVFSNLSDEEYIFGEQPYLEIFLNDEWYVVPYQKDVVWNMLAYILSPHDSREHTVDLKYNFGKLKAGKYRVIKELTSTDVKTFAIAEFTIQEE